MARVPVRDERRHPAGPEKFWSESWYFDFVAADGSVGGYARLGLYPHLRTAWFWAGLVGVGRRLVAVRDHDIALRRGESLEIRGGALWSMFNCETPLDHWSMGLEAYAVALDDPTEAYRGERGDRVGLGFDLEWEARSPAVSSPGGGHYEQSCLVHGEVLVGDEQLLIDGSGQRYHRWGVEDWWSSSWCRASGTLSDGGAFSAWSAHPAGGVAGDGSRACGYLASTVDEAAAGPEVEIDVTPGHSDLVSTGAVSVGDLLMTVHPVADAPVVLDAPDGRQARLLRALCRYRAGDGRNGGGWVEWLHAPPADR